MRIPKIQSPLRSPWLSRSILGLATVCCTDAAFATNGTMPHGYGIQAQGMGGVSIALPQDSLAAANNPAGMAFVGDRLDIGLAVVLPKPESVIAGTHYDGDGDKAIAIPEFGYNRVIDEHQTIGISVYGNGVSTKYDSKIGQGSGKDGANLTQVIASPTYTYKFSPGQAIGVSLDLAYQRFRVTGVPDGTGKEGQGYDSSTGMGFKLGWTGRINDKLTLGAMYSSRTRMGKLDKYRNLLADAGLFDVPERYGVGVAWFPTERLTLAADVMRINWGDIKSLANAVTANQPGFGWQNQTVTRIGGAWEADAKLTLRAGYSFGTQIIRTDSTALDYLAPVTPQRHLTFGATWHMDPSTDVSLVYAKVYSDYLNGSGASTGTNVKMTQDWVGIGLGKKF